MIQFTRARADSGSANLVLGSDRELKAARAVFLRNHCVKVPRFLASDLFAEILAEMRPEDFYERTHEGFGSEACLRHDSPVVTLLWLLVNDDQLFRFVEALTGCSAIGSFFGRVYRITDSPSHHDEWHDDLVDNRLVALSLNLSSEPFDGGLLQIRDRATGEILHEESNVAPGDALIFQIAPELQHRVGRVTGNRPKTAFAGWFKSEPDFKTLVGLRRPA